MAKPRATRSAKRRGEYGEEESVLASESALPEVLELEEEMDGESKVEQPVHKRRREQPANVDESDSDDESASLEVR